MDWMVAGRHYVFQQDGAPAHNSKMAQEWCAANLPEFWSKEICPSSGPDCNPLDYYVWSVCGQDVNKAPQNTATLLMFKITEVMANLLRDTVAKAFKRFRPCIKAVVEAGDDFFK
jgi:hypothetical protein